ncbi:hypothetical protein MTR67_026126 [Solanum verrucosum]|uniref:Uncharacterized protein n=1 Tax=Solanum verrucosum TaxID=315347 RepID=A0AAF0R6H3_SOLVR|nr:hypothetical protein MTR67_026126 [Solanum verrucosum]
MAVDQHARHGRQIREIRPSVEPRWSLMVRGLIHGPYC